MLKVAAGAIYTTRDVQGVSPPRLRRFFLLGRGPREGSFRVVPEIRDLVKFRHLDLRNPAWAVPNDFHDHLLPQRLDLLRRGRAAVSAQPPGAALAAGRLAGHGQRRDPAIGARRRFASTPHRSSRRRGERPCPCVTVILLEAQQHRSRRPIDVLVVDDSAVVRQRLKAIIESDPHFSVTLAADPYEAVAMLSKSVPGVIVLDVEMPRMDGLTFLRKLMRQHPMPVVLCTAQAERAVTALEMGAIEVIAKPDWQDATRLSEWSQNLLESIRNAARAGRLPFRDEQASQRRPPAHRRRRLAKVRVLTPHWADGPYHRGRCQHRWRTGHSAVAGRISARFPRHCDRSAHAGRLSRRHLPSGLTPISGSRSRWPRRGTTIRSGQVARW